jgi:NADH-quinone oxidoreductase subunit M
MYLIIGIWGGPNKIYAAFKFFLYTLLGSLLMLVALVYLYTKSGGSFDIMTWHKLPLSLSAQTLLFFAFFASFAVKVPMWPVHTWLPDVHVEAPTGGSAVLAAIMLKLGAYGFLRFAMPIAPDASREYDWLMIGLSLIAVVYVGLVAMVQQDMKKLVAYSSVAHMGFVTLGFFIFNDLGVAGGIVQMIAHGFRVRRDVPLHRRAVRPCPFARDRKLWRSREHHAQLHRFRAAVLHGQLRLAGHGRFRRRVDGDHWRGEGELLAGRGGRFGVVFGAAYTLWMFKRVYLGPVANDDVKELTDINAREFLMLGLLASRCALHGRPSQAVYRHHGRVGGGFPQARGHVEVVSRH